jgi:lipoate-protein ligase A
LTGNLNITVLTTREDYNRQRNLLWMVDTLNAAFSLNLHRTERDDVWLDQYKVTGSASRLERLYAYHHFTLLLDANLPELRRSLKSPDLDKVTSKATASVRSSVLNLNDRNKTINYESTVQTLIDAFPSWVQSIERIKPEYIDPSLHIESLRTFEDELRSERFLYLATPPFVYTFITIDGISLKIEVANGVITGIEPKTSILDVEKYIGQMFHRCYSDFQTRQGPILSK